MYTQGYIKLHRQMVEWGWYQEDEVKILFIHLLLKANFKEKEWKGEILKPGQLVTSISQLARELGKGERVIRTALSKLQKTKEISIKPTSKYSVITITKWAEYQASEVDGGEFLSEAQQGQDMEVTDIRQEQDKYETYDRQQKKNKKKKENLKNVKKERKYIRSDDSNKFFPLDEKLDQTFRDFIKHRESIDQPMTENAARLMIGKLEKMTEDNNERIAILEESIMNGWKGIFPLQGEQKKKSEGNVFLKLAKEFANDEEVDLYEKF